MAERLPTKSKKIISCHPSNLFLLDHVECFVALNRSPSRLKFSEALLGVHATFDGSMIRFENVVQVLHRSVSTAVAQRPFLLTVGDRRAVNRCQVGVDHSRLGMGSIAECLAKQPLGSIGVTKRRQQEINGGSPGIDGPVQVAPATLHTDVGFVDSPRLVCRLEMLSQSLLQFRAVILHPAPDRGVIDIETALLQQFLNIAQRKRIAKIPPDRTKYEAGFGLPPFEDRGSGFHFAILSRHQPATQKSCNTSLQTETDEYARYELLLPESASFAIPYGKKTHLRFRGREVYPTEGSCRFPLIVLQQAAQPLPTPHLSLFSTDCLSRQRE